MEELNFDVFRELTQLTGVSGYEREVREYIRKAVEPLADEITVDAIGDLIAVKHGTLPDGKRKRMMLAAHMDEIGVQVIRINDDGTLMVKSMGCSWMYTTYQARVRFRSGLIGVVAARVRPNVLADDKFTNLFVDIGVTTKEEAMKFVKVGDVACYVGEYSPLAGEYVVSKAVDNRVGCFMLMETMKKNPHPANDVYYVFTVQEEVGCRGGIVAAERINPDFGIAVDVTPDHGRPGDLEGSNVCGNGTAVKISDTSVICDEQLVEKMEMVCERDHIRHQRDVIYVGGTDASGINLARYGIRAGGVSVVTRYTHGTNCIVSKRDIADSVQLLAALEDEEYSFE